MEAIVSIISMKQSTIHIIRAMNCAAINLRAYKFPCLSSDIKCSFDTRMNHNTQVFNFLHKMTFTIYQVYYWESAVFVYIKTKIHTHSFFALTLNHVIDISHYIYLIAVAVLMKIEKQYI